MTEYNSKDVTFMLRYWDGKSPWFGPQLDGPGWYITSNENEGYASLYPTQKIDAEQAEKIAKAIDAVVARENKLKEGTLWRAVRRLNTHLVHLLHDERKNLDRVIAQRASTVAALEEVVKTVGPGTPV